MWRLKLQLGCAASGVGLSVACAAHVAAGSYALAVFSGCGFLFAMTLLIIVSLD